MPLQWNVPNLKVYQGGLSQVMVWSHVGPITSTDTALAGAAWEGVQNLTEKPTGSEITELYANDVEYAQLVSPEEMEGSIQAYAWPALFNASLGVRTPVPGLIIPQQRYDYFSVAYKTRLHSDGGGEDIGYQIHALYNLTVQPFDRNNMTISDSPVAQEFSWDFTATKVTGVPGISQPFSKLVFDSRFTSAPMMANVNTQIYTNGNLLNPWAFFTAFPVPA